VLVQPHTVPGLPQDARQRLAVSDVPAAASCTQAPLMSEADDGGENLHTHPVSCSGRPADRVGAEPL
jgi:hypothetical protein